MRQWRFQQPPQIQNTHIQTPGNAIDRLANQYQSYFDQSKLRLSRYGSVQKHDLSHNVITMGYMTRLLSAILVLRLLALPICSRHPLAVL
jgi:hypothetical protein